MEEYVISKAFFEDWEAEELANEIELLRTDDWDDAYNFLLNVRTNWNDNTSCKKYMKTIFRYDGKEVYYLAAREHQDVPIANKILDVLSKMDYVGFGVIQNSSNRFVYNMHVEGVKNQFHSNEDFNLVRGWLDNGGTNNKQL